MKKKMIVWATAAICFQTAAIAAKPGHDYPIRPVPFTQVSFADSFWQPRLETNRTVTIPFAFRQCTETGRIKNFEIAGGSAKGAFCTRYPFDDSDVYKIIEGAAYVLAERPDPELDSYVDGLIAKIAAAQEKDGYLYTARTIDPAHPPEMAGRERFSNEYMSHELYNAGHLYEAAAAHFQATGKRMLLDIAQKNADFLVREFGPNKRRDPPGHQVIEIGLSKLYRISGDERYLELARFFLDERGNVNGHKLYGEYSQDHIPVVQQSEAVGHAVRAAYMYAGMADVAALTGDPGYVRAIDRLWDDVAEKKLYLTGGIGATGAWEGFGPAYELPNASAYAETCAAIANAMWNHRMFLLHGNAKYIDLLERILYNGVLSGYSLSGDRFFYPNPLTSFGQHQRSPWFTCACCPSNIARFIPSIPGYAYATAGNSIYVNLFAAGKSEIRLGGRTINVEQKTEYPWQGEIELIVSPATRARFTLRLRVPGWALGKPVPTGLYRYLDSAVEKPALLVNGQALPLKIDKGYAVLEREWQKGDSVKLILPMPVHRVVAHDAVKEDCGRVAIERGPVVFCAEWTDNGGRVLDSILADDVPARISFQKGLLGGVTTIAFAADGARLEKGKSMIVKKSLTLIPYYAWAHRGRGEMSVWIARTPERARPAPEPSLASLAKATSSGGTGLAGINDQYEPDGSGDRSTPYLHWWPRKGTREWVQYDFPGKNAVSGVSVYWYDDTGSGECRVPRAWRVLQRSGGEWLPVKNLGPYGTARDRFNDVRFRPVVTDGLKLEVDLPEKYSSGIQEWKVAEAKTMQEAGEIPNPSFEVAEAGQPVAWKPADWRRTAAFGLDTIAHDGKSSARIASEKGTDAYLRSEVEVRPYSRYRLSGWIRTDSVQSLGGKGALLALLGMQGMQTPAIAGTRDWTRVELIFDTGGNDTIRVACCLGSRGEASGTAWFDDLRLELLAARKMAPAATVHAGRTRAPISKYIFGQFIEHLGRCIYGGIWVEMLEDRKFYHAVGGPDSPWKVIGPAGNITMNPLLAYAGAHAPQVRLKGQGAAGGLFQENLEVAAGQGYVGHIVLAGDPGAAPVEISLVWGDSPAERQTVTVSGIGDAYRTYPLSFTAGAASDAARLEICSRGGESFRIGAVSLMPAANTAGFRPDVLALLKELDSPVYRWPGGNFVSGYDWRDGIGDRDRRPPRKNPAWLGIEANDVGIDEFMELCRLIGAEPYVAVNSGQGNETMAAAEVEYVNGGAATPMGRLRAQNGHAEPYGCRFWSIGNEMYGDWQLGHMPEGDFVRRHNRFAAAMKAVDPAIRIVAVGEVGKWDELMLEACGGSMDLISEHFYCGDITGTLSHAAQIPLQVRRIADAHRRYRRTIPALAGRDIRIALDEWNYWYGPYIYGELGTQYFLKDALGIAAGLHEYFRQSDIIFMANYAQTVNVIGAIKTSKTAAVLDTTGLVLKLYRGHFGTIPVEVSGGAEPLDLAAAWSEDRRALTVAVVNPTATAQVLALKIEGAPIPKEAHLMRICGTDPFLCNVPGSAPQVAIQETVRAAFGPRLEIPALSISIFRLDQTSAPKGR